MIIQLYYTKRKKRSGMMERYNIVGTHPPSEIVPLKHGGVVNASRAYLRVDRTSSFFTFDHLKTKKIKKISWK